MFDQAAARSSLQQIGNPLKILNEALHLGMAGCGIGRAKDGGRVHGGHDMRRKGTFDKSPTVLVHADVSS